MKCICLGALTIAGLLPVLGQGITSATAVRNGQIITFTSEMLPKIEAASINLLSGCAYKDLQPKREMADIQKQDHLRLTFARPRPIAVPIEAVTVEVKDMVISLPLSSGGIWVLTDSGVTYFAKFKPAAAEELNLLLSQALR